eukprot:CAMPEP_0117025686 /NCGR_PEP_ID=MMETSP0472-20121206/18955_1 /TAXON_ID=693140 ORGANISM="Tiarina fusus, Strain LIS" /NCGR_SAMPLE_ID=MMETSP0472 /ASSEMBLY_ACC=CAM_ASM_000603 /LENGTH=654 /DNA_ID=CAMNT_0004732481 /DNA_START=215 /DNA_END=2179 /DNA_ORIENTATION=+
MSPMAKKITMEDEFLLKAVQMSMETGKPMSSIPPTTISVRMDSSKSLRCEEDVVEVGNYDHDDDDDDDASRVPSRVSLDDSQDQTASTNSNSNSREESTCTGTVCTKNRPTTSVQQQRRKRKQHVVTPNSEATNHPSRRSGDLQRFSKTADSHSHPPHPPHHHLMASPTKTTTSIGTSTIIARRDSNVTFNSDEDLNKMLIDTTTFDSPISPRRMMDDSIAGGSSQRFYLETSADDDEYSIPSKVSMPEQDDHDDEDEYLEERGQRSYGEWMSIVRTLYESLQLADSKLGMERQRRRSREQNLVKLAKELSKRNEISRTQKRVIDKLREQLVVERTEKSLLDSRLQHYVYAYGEDKADTREELERELAEARKLREDTCAEYEARIQKMNKSHAKQCEDICREVIETNRENIRLKQQVADLTSAGTKGSSTSAAAIRRRSMKRRASWKALKRNKGLQMRLLFAVLVFAGCAYFHSSAILGRQKNGTAGLVRRDSREYFSTDDSSSAKIVPVQLEELLQDDESDDESVVSQAASATTSVTTTTASEDASDVSVAQTVTDADFVEVASSERSLPHQQEQVFASSTASLSSTNEDAAPTTTSSSSSNKKSPLRKRTGAWLRKRVAKIGSKLKNTFGKKFGDEGRRVQFFLRSRHANML